ncbi:MAG: type VI secretion system TssO [Ferruginibacter sp.]
MQPNNRSQRRKATINFMLLFLLCTAIIVTTVFTSIKVPFSHNEVLLKDKKNTETRNRLQKEITDKMFSISQTIDSLDVNKVTDFTQLDIRIANEITMLSTLAVNAEVEDKKLYMNIATNLSSYYNAKKSARQKIDVNSNQDVLNQRIEVLTEQRDEYKDKYFNCISPKNNAK